jgi:aryl-alcohol dehydrogenase-like predicted oxidoreductase
VLVVTRRIGDGSITTSQLGFGTARLYGGLERRHAWRLLERAYEIGIRHFDTAPAYGHGQAENLVGDVFVGVQDITLTTKVGIPRPTGRPSLASTLRRMTMRRALSYVPSLKRRLIGKVGLVRRSGREQFRHILDADCISRSIDESLKRLRRTIVDFYLIHEPDSFELDEQVFATFEALKLSGAIRAHGLAWDRVAASAPQGWDVVQARYAANLSRDGRLRIFHGLLRYGSSADPGQLGTVMQNERDAILLVSASEPHQLSQLARRLCL